MFTGLVQAVGRVVDAPAAGRLAVEARLPGGPLAAGESVAVSGVCLTVVEAAGDHLCFNVSTETLSVTTLGGLAPGLRVNLERALTLADRLGGHLVTGHVDGTCTLAGRVREGEGLRDTYEVDPSLARYIARKGSVALDGVSLTVASVSRPRRRGGRLRFSVALIPHTVAVTTLGQLRPGDRLNLEVDLVARYLETLFPGMMLGELDRLEGARARSRPPR